MSLSFLKILSCWYSPFQKMKIEKFSCWTSFSYFSAYFLFNYVRYLEFLLFPRSCPYMFFFLRISCPYMLKVPFTHLYDYEHLNVSLTFELHLSANGLGLNGISFPINKGWRLRSLVQSVHKCELYYLLLFFLKKTSISVKIFSVNWYFIAPSFLVSIVFVSLSFYLNYHTQPLLKSFSRIPA